MSITLTVEDFVRQRLDDRTTIDYFPADRELEMIVWRQVICRTTPMELNLAALEIRSVPLPTPGVSSVGSFWIYDTSQYANSLFCRALACCAFDQLVHQPIYKYALFNSNVYVNSVVKLPIPDVDEINLAVQFAAVQSGTVSMRGYVVNINMVMHDVFMAIANDIGKLALYQSTLSGATDLRGAATEARHQAGLWLSGKIIPKRPLRGARR